MTTSSVENGLRQDIERTREQLGDTVEALTHKVTVPARAKDKAHDIKETLHLRAEEVTQQAQTKVEEVTQHVQEGTEALQAKAGKAARRAKNLTRRALGKLPSRVAARIEPLTATAKQRPLPTAAVAVGMGAVVIVVLRRLLRRNT
ncbi:MAG: DUF3618 domain-containing protein [Pseudonocardiaceae bacterium]